MKPLTQLLTLASLLVILLAVASAFAPMDDDELRNAAEEIAMEYPELFMAPDVKRAKMTGFNSIDTLKMMRARENIRKLLKSQNTGRRRRLSDN